MTLNLPWLVNHLSGFRFSSAERVFYSLLFFTLIFATTIQPSYSHPVVFQGGTAVSGHHHGDVAEIEVVHSPSWWTGYGLSAERTPHSTRLLAKATALLWRGNYPDLQTNMYLGLGGGQQWNSHPNQNHADGNERARSSIYLISTEWDAEDRQYYGRIRYNLSFMQNETPKSELLTRIGFAPYKANSDELALWGMLEWTASDPKSIHKKEHEITPLIRLFYRNALFEIGSSLSGKFSFNYMFHYF